MGKLPGECQAAGRGGRRLRSREPQWQPRRYLPAWLDCDGMFQSARGRYRSARGQHGNDRARRQAGDSELPAARVVAAGSDRGDLRLARAASPLAISNPVRSSFQRELAREIHERLDRALAHPAKPRDTDLAIQIPTVLQRGKCLYGRAAARVLPSVPDSDQTASVVQDFYWARKRILKIPAYFVLNSCRIYAFLVTRRIYSKDEGCAWAIRRFPRKYRAVVRSARDAYRHGESELLVSAPELRTYARWIANEIRCATRVGNSQS